MKNFILFLLVLGVSVFTPKKGYGQEYVIQTAEDLPDDDLTDNIWQPKSLRAAIENINKNKVPAKINCSLFEYKTLKINSSLHVINVRVEFDAKGMVLEPSATSTATYGLWFTGNNSILKNIKIRGFNGIGLVWQASDGLIANSVFSNNNGPGINMNNAHRNRIGDTTIGYYNILLYGNKGTGGSGLAMIKCDNNIIQYCWSGIDSLGNPVPNERYGILIDEGVGNIIRYCTISGNQWSGIYIENKNEPMNTLIVNNRIGTDYLGQVPIPNQGNGGIDIYNSQSNTIKDNIISGNSGNGIYVASITCKGIVIENNMIGTDRLSKKAVPNGIGIRLNGSEHKVENNIISGNLSTGLSVSGQDMIIKSNIIGLDKQQKIAIPNKFGIGASTYSGTLVIGDTVGNLSNVIAGNNGDGVSIRGASVKNVIIARNVIGANIDTSLIFPNKGSGIIMTHSLSDIKIKDNLISADSLHGIRIERNVVIFLDTTKPNIIQKPSNITIKNNCIGCAGSNVKLGKHGGSGISVLNSDSIFIDSNTITGTAGSGIDIANDSTRFIRITHNEIGPIRNTVEEQRIGGDGIHVSGAKDVYVGNPLSSSDSNNIRNCKGFGLSVQDSARLVYAFANSMIDNELGGIALDDLTDYFDSGKYDDNLDADEGSNGLENTVKQRISSIKNDSLHIAGSINVKPNNIYTIDVYLAKKPNRGFEYQTQGSIHIGWFIVKPDAQGRITIDNSWADKRVGVNSTTYPFVTMTVSGTDGTSPFSIIQDDNVFVDIAVSIDTANSYVDNDGNVKLTSIISNIGNDISTTVSVRDTVSNFDVKDMFISKGVIGKYDSSIVATIPLLSPGETVTYTAYGKAAKPGIMKRLVKAIPSEVDRYPQNNSDSISFSIITVKNNVPIPKFPLGGEKKIDNPLRFKWFSLKDALRYHLQVSKGKFTVAPNNNPDARAEASVLIVDDSTITDTTYTLGGLEGKQVYYWRVSGLFSNGNEINWSDTLPFTTVDVTEVFEFTAEDQLRLFCTPNPVRDGVEITFRNNRNSDVSLSIFDNLGQEKLRLFHNETLNIGEFRYNVNTSNLTSGMYVVRLTIGNRVIAQPLVIVH